MLRSRTRTWFVAGLALAAGVSLAAAPGSTRADEKSRQQQISDLEKQIQQLTKQLGDLKNGTPRTASKPASASPASDTAIPANWVKALTWRSIGPANMGGRITAIAAYEADPTTYWVATASGGLAKTVNNGITFEHQFDKENTVSIGDVCVAPSNRDIVWVGTGEANPRNSVSYGDGVYKSEDGGKTWKHMGLEKTFQIGRIKIHPQNPDIVYVGALGRLYGPNEDRGVYKTTDGGKNWTKVLFLDERTGIIDLQMNPNNPDVLIAAAWERQRDEFDDFQGEPPPEGVEQYDPVRKFGKKAGIYKTTDAGEHWRKIETGLPTAMMGRIGLDYYRKDPNVVFAVLETEKIGTGLPPVTVFTGFTPGDAKKGVKLTEVAKEGPAATAGLKAGDVLVSVDDKPVENRAALYDVLRAKKTGDKLKLAYERQGEKKEVELALAGAPAGRGGGGFARFLNPGFMGEDAEGGLVVTEMDQQGAAAKAGLKIDDLVTAIDGKPVQGMRQTFAQISQGHRPGDKITLTVLRDREKKDITVPLQQGGLEGMTGGRPKGHMPRPNTGELGGQRPNVQDMQGPEGPETGGVYKSTDGGESWARINSVNPRPMYFSQIRVDPTDEKYLYVLGVQMYSSKDGGKTFGTEGNRGVHSDQHALWIDPRDGRHMIIGCDGGFYQTYDRAQHWDHLNHLALGQFYHVAVDPRPLYRALGGLQDNGSWAGPTRTRRPTGPINQDWIMIGGGDGFVCRVDPTDPDLVYAESQGGMIQRRNLRTGEVGFCRPLRTPGKPKHRFNWNTPFILSSHNPSIFYCAGEYVWRSVEKGDHLRIISPEITRSKKGSATALAESPKNSEVLYVGTDDGALWVTRNGGAQWTEIGKNAGLPGPRCVATIEPSRFSEGRAYVAFDAHRSDDDDPYVYVTEDFGQTWKPLRGNLPTGSTRCCREDITSPDILYVGTEFAAWVSVNRGEAWTKLNYMPTEQGAEARTGPGTGARGEARPEQERGYLPTVAVHEFAQHPTSGEIVVATHGRSLWVVDVTPLRQMKAEALKAKAHLYEPNKVIEWTMEQGRGGWFAEAERAFIGQNPPPGAQIFYSLTDKAESLSLTIQDYAGKTVARLRGPATPGLHRVAWNLREGGGPAGRGIGRGGFGRGGLGVAFGGGERPRGPGAGGGTVAGGRTPAAGGPRPGGARPQAPPTPEEPAQEMPAEMAMFFGGGAGTVAPGVYKVTLTVDGKDLVQYLKVEPDPSRPAASRAAEAIDDDLDP